MTASPGWPVREGIAGGYARLPPGFPDGACIFPSALPASYTLLRPGE